MKGLWGLMVVVMSTGTAALVSAAPLYLNDTLTAGEGAASSAIKTVVIDAGHGGRDAGCSGSNSNEKTIALHLALELGERIKSSHPEVEVIYTREHDVFVPLYERASIANRAQADLFISLHCNYMVGGAHVHGSETYVMGLHTADHNLAVAKRENEAIRLEANIERHYDFDPDSPTGHIILSMFQHAFLEQSVAAAEAFEARLGERDGRRSRGVRQAGFVVLKETAMPSVLIETGYLSNATEEAYLLDAEGREATVDALYRGFRTYLRDVDEGAGKRRIVSIEPSAPVAIPTPTAAPSLSYYVQLAAAKREINTQTARWLPLQGRVRYLKEGGYTKYQLGPAASATDAKALLAEARDAGFKDAWIVGYRDNQRVKQTDLGL